MIRLAAAQLTILLVAIGCGPATDPSVTRVAEVALRLGPRDTPPPADDARWQQVTLPDVWTIARRRVAREGWYRATVALGAPGDDLGAVYLPWASERVAVYVNGVLVGRGSEFADERRATMDAPMLAVIPAGMLRVGGNVIDLRFGVAPGTPSVLMPFYVGPEHVLRSAYRVRRFLRVALVEGLATVMCGIALVLWVAYWPRDPTGAYRWIAASTLSLAVATGQDVWRLLPMTAWMASGLWAMALNGFIACLVMGFHRALGKAAPRREGVMWIVFLGGAGAVLLAGEHAAFTASTVWLMAMLPIGAYLLALVVQAQGHATLRHPRLALAAGVAALAAGLHDLGVVFTATPLLDVFLVPYMGVGIVVVGVWGLVSNLLGALRDTEELNRTLEHRVAEKGRELERNHAQLRDLERDRVIAVERERIMRDMHDGMGGQLVSTLALVETGHAPPAVIGEAIRDALDDLRLVIDSLDPVEGDLATLLGMIRGRLEPRLGRHGLGFSWHIVDLPPLANLSPARALQVMRIVQEAITNVVKHAHARTVTVRTGAEDRSRPGVFVEVADDGDGFPTTARPGRGLANMQRRAKDLGAIVEVSSAGRGTCVHLWLPSAIA